MSATYVVGFDVGTTGAKTCLFRVDGSIELVGKALRQYPLRMLPNGGAEQDPLDWWRALGEGTREVLARAGLPASAVSALSFSSQMQGLVLVDADGQPLRPAMSYLDSRGVEPYRRVLKRGLRVAGFNASLLARSLLVTGGLSASVKDPVWKYLWVRQHEPELFARVCHWLDVKDWLGLRCTGRAAMTEDSAHATFLYDTRPGRGRWSDALVRIYGVERRHLPEVVPCTTVLGPLTAPAAADLGLEAGVQVVAGGGDLTMTALGCGCVAPGDAHVYVGTSGWVSTVTARREVDLDHFMASIIGARPGHYNYIGEQETSGKCLEWARDALAVDDLGLHGPLVTEPGEVLEVLARAAGASPAGAGGVLFAPWLHGNRSPFEDPHARGVFFNLGLGTSRAALLRAVLEGVALHKRWLLDCTARKTPVREPLRFAGGGAASDITCQILADVTGRSVEAVAHPQTAGAMGAAVLCGLAQGALRGFDELRDSIPLRGRYTPDPARRALHERQYGVFRQLHARNRKLFAQLNGGPALQG
jgi:xylulokinase